MASPVWKLRGTGERMADETAEQFQIQPLLRCVLEARGIRTPEQIRDTVDVPRDWGDPYALHDMGRAAGRIRQALDRGEKITVYGDYDVDGLTSSYILWHWLSAAGADCALYIPDRIREGYGVHTEAVQRIAADGTRLLITADCGVTAADAVAAAYAEQMQVVVTDHHAPDAALPACEALVNPHLGCPAALAALAGVGVALYVLAALEGDMDAVFQRYGDMAALGTLADVAPVSGVNRRIIAEGVPRIAETKNVGLRALLAETIKNENLTAQAVAYRLAPRINAAGRMRSPYDALRLFQAETEAEAAEAAAQLCMLNTERQTEEARMHQQAAALAVASGAEISTAHAVVLASPGWKHSIIGITASRLSEQYGLPAVLFAEEGEILRGSARSIAGFDICAALRRAIAQVSANAPEPADGLYCGGHAMAAGITCPKALYPAFVHAFRAVCAAEVQQEIRTLTVDAVVNASMLTVQSLRDLERLAPYGPDNPGPVLALEDAQLLSVQGMGGGKHLRIKLSDGGRQVAAVQFSQPPHTFRYQAGDAVDIAFHAGINAYQGSYTPQMLVEAVRPARVRREAEAAAAAAVCLAINGEEDPEMPRLKLPDRTVLIKIWRRLELAAGWTNVSPALIGHPLVRAGEAAETDILLALALFEQSALCRCVWVDPYGYNAQIVLTLCTNRTEKADFSRTPLYRNLMKSEGL